MVQKRIEFSKKGDEIKERNVGMILKDTFLFHIECMRLSSLI